MTFFRSGRKDKDKHGKGKRKYKWYCHIDGIDEEYDKKSSKLLEEAYQAGTAKVVLADGYFRKHPNVYSVHFKRKPHKVRAAQINANTQFKRKVFRDPPMRGNKKRKIHSGGHSPSHPNTNPNPRLVHAGPTMNQSSYSSAFHVSPHMPINPQLMEDDDDDTDTIQWYCLLDGMKQAYDENSNELIEKAYQQKDTTDVVLRHGYFARFEEGMYRVVFDRSHAPTHVFQVNTQTGFKRSVGRKPSLYKEECAQREEEEEHEMLKEYQKYFKLLTPEDFQKLNESDLTCSICFEVFTIENSCLKLEEDMTEEESKKAELKSTKGQLQVMADLRENELSEKVMDDIADRVADKIATRIADRFEFGDRIEKATSDDSDEDALMTDSSFARKKESKKNGSQRKEDRNETEKVVKKEVIDLKAIRKSLEVQREEREEEEKKEIDSLKLQSHRIDASSVKSDLLNEELAVALSECPTHIYHIGCIMRWLPNKRQCPICKRSYGVVKGNQPPGTMHSQIVDFSCAGYEKHKTIQITFSFPGGIQGKNHPTPGKSYYPDSRVAYLPNNKEGQQVFKLIKIAFERRLIFDIGYSITRHVDGVIVWNGIHMKTSPTGGTHSHGYPDETYFARVKDELKSKGVTESDIEEQ